LTRTQPDVRDKIATNFKGHPTGSALSIALGRCDYLKKTGKRGSFRFIRKYESQAAPLTDDAIPEEVVKALGKAFETDIRDLQLNNNQSANCTAFLLRKMLEKLIFKAFAKHGKLDLLMKDKKTKKLMGLDDMLGGAANTQVDGKPYLSASSEKKIRAAKFLGDTAAHNPNAYAHHEEIRDNMAYVITAFEELASKL
jgi:hypothetical protein